MVNAGIVTVGTTRRDLVVTIVDANGNVVSLSATVGNHLLQGRSTDAPLVTINTAASAVNTGTGEITFGNIGALVTQANLTTAGQKKAQFVLQVKYIDNVAKVDFIEKFGLLFDQDLLQLP